MPKVASSKVCLTSKTLAIALLGLLYSLRSNGQSRDEGLKHLQAIQDFTTNTPTIKTVVFEFEAGEKRLVKAKLDPEGQFFKVISDPSRSDDDRSPTDWFASRYQSNYWCFTVDKSTLGTNIVLNPNLVKWVDKGGNERNNEVYFACFRATAELSFLLSMGIGPLKMDTLQWSGDQFVASGLAGDDSYEGKMTLNSANNPEIHATRTDKRGRKENYSVRYEFGPQTANLNLPSVINGKVKITIKSIQVAARGTLLGAPEFDPLISVPAIKYSFTVITNNGLFEVQSNGSIRPLNAAIADQALRGDERKRLWFRISFALILFLGSILVALKASRILKERHSEGG